MTIQRRSDYGLPPQTPPPSATTVRMVPLTQGMTERFPVTNLPPGSSTSLLNFIPYDGMLAPRSRWSSIGTMLRLGTPGVDGYILGMTEVPHGGSGNDLIWAVGNGSTTTDNLFTIYPSDGSLSQASFVSAAGMGTKPNWSLSYNDPVGFTTYASVFDDVIYDDILIIALPFALGSGQSLLAAGLTITGNGPIYSYLTGAPKAAFVASYDNYVLGWNTIEGSLAFPRRVRWCDRGDPGNWTPGGASTAGFEDLLSMSGDGTGITVLDNRLILFSQKEVWVGLPSTYPSQFQFYPLDTTVGCPSRAAKTIAVTELGVVFLGSDLNLRMLPRGGGLSQIINPDIGDFLRNETGIFTVSVVPWAIYDGNRRLYYLYPQKTESAFGPGIVVNLNTGEWGRYVDVVGRTAGCFVRTEEITGLGGGRSERFYSGTTNGKLYSTDSRKAGDMLTSTSSLPVTATFQSIPMGLDLPESRRQLTGLQLTYKATSISSGAMKASGDFGNTFPASGSTVTLTSAPRGGIVDIDLMQDGPAPVIEWSSTQTGYELHRLSATFNLRGSV